MRVVLKESEYSAWLHDLLWKLSGNRAQCARFMGVLTAMVEADDTTFVKAGGGWFTVGTLTCAAASECVFVVAVIPLERPCRTVFCVCRKSPLLCWRLPKCGRRVHPNSPRLPDVCPTASSQPDVCSTGRLPDKLSSRVHMFQPVWWKASFLPQLFNEQLGELSPAHQGLVRGIVTRRC